MVISMPVRLTGSLYLVLSVLEVTVSRSTCSIRTKGEFPHIIIHNILYTSIYIQHVMLSRLQCFHTQNVTLN